ncbi:MAG: polysaccharide deacetylase family protein [Clostridia bacterium]|nr:polysaccharide deacetylase family protein [Clostridia bacterium]
MKKIKIIFVLTAALFLFSFSITADSAQSWYCKREKDHQRPCADANMSYITEEGGFYLGRDEKVIYLTFDAGYENGNIERILDTLQKHNAEGAFFILENLINRNPALVKRMKDEGHLVCNHTAHHKDMTKLSEAEIEAELRALETLYAEKIGGALAPFYRPPEGKFDRKSLSAAKKCGYHTAFWSLAYADWDNAKQPSPAYAKKLLCENIHNGAVVLLHPTSKTNADILDDLLSTWEAEGYRFGSLNEISADACTASASTEKEKAVIRAGSPDSMKIALTFDDGPHPKKTDALLNLLEKNGIRATFFVIGENVEYYPAPLKRAVALGHEIGNHTYHHVLLSRLDEAEAKKEILSTEEIIWKTAGYQTKILRPPEGAYTESALQTACDSDYRVVLWNTDSRDWENISTEKIVQNVEKNIRGGSIVLFHDYTGKHTLEALQILIPKLKAEGYEFVTVSELLG